ncbi:MAG: hypothetical protein FH748_14870 [Balneolaceae bacterium]|nr:hypothetical protein [Balneolaceae bacterium]
MDLNKRLVLVLMLTGIFFTGCLRYSFTGASIPEGVNTIFIPFFPDQSNSGLGDLGDRLNQALIERFVNQSKLQLANNASDADAVLEGVITSYTNRPFSIGGDEQANRNQVSVSVRASFKYNNKDEAEWNSSFNGSATFDTAEDPINGERDAADEALQQVANNMFNDAVSNW